MSVPVPVPVSVPARRLDSGSFVHGASEAAADEGHQTETPVPARTWDPELVPGASGRTARPEPGCPVEVALAAVAGRWTTLVLRELMHGPQSFSGLRTRLPGLSAKVLTERLRALEERSLVTRDRLPGFPVRTRYRLTEAGQELRPLLIELYRTGTALHAARENA